MDDLAETAARLKRKSTVDAQDVEHQSEGSARSARRVGSARSLGSGRASICSARNSWASRMAYRRATTDSIGTIVSTPRGEDKVERKMSLMEVKSLDDLLDTVMSARSYTSARSQSARSTGVFSIATPRVAPSATIEKLRATMTQDEIRTHVRERRVSNQKRRLSVTEHADDGCEMICSRTVEEPCCPQVVQHHPMYQKYCGSALVPLRRGENGEEIDDTGKKKTSSFSNVTEEIDDTGKKKTSSFSNVTERNLGLPHFRDSGYSLDCADENPLDASVTKTLGLKMATNRKTCVEKMCFVLPKQNIPASYTKAQIINVLRNLKQCDHVNILRFYEAFEDPQTLYLMFESYPCTSLLSVLEEHCWTQEQMVSVVRECCAAFAYAASMNLYHVGLTLSHILLPRGALKDPTVSKVFGFGMMGQLIASDSDVRCWAPAAIGNYKKYGPNFVIRMDVKTKIGCDIWSLGAVIFSIVSHRPPVLGNEESLRALIIAHKWSFPVAFDAIDGEAKGLVEQMLARNENKRMKPKEALHNPWIRRRWQQPARGRRTFHRLEEFCRSSLPKKLFGRFLVNFLNSEQLRDISRSFYSLDAQGDGVLCKNDLKLAAAEYAEHPKAALDAIVSWMCPDENTVPLLRFAESLAEDLLDGPVLRSAFESLDDDGSECISPAELYQELQQFDKRLTLEDVIAYMEETELDVGGGEDEANCLLEFDEFVRLFPERLHRLKLLEERAAAQNSTTNDLTEKLDTVKEEIRKWLKLLQEERIVLQRLGIELLGKKGDAFAYELKEHLKTVGHLLSNPPGPHDIASQFDDPIGRRKKKKKDDLAEVYGYDSFMQEHATAAFWPILIDDDKVKLRNAIVKRSNKPDKIDRFGAHDVAQNVLNKIEDVMEWTNHQLEEYESFIEIFQLPEQSMPTMTISHRGLPQLQGEKTEEWDEEKLLIDGDAEVKSTAPCAQCICQCWNDDNTA